MAYRQPDNTKRKNFNFPPDVCEILAELAELENTTENKAVQNALRYYYIGKRMEKSISSMKSFDLEKFSNILSGALADEFEKRKLVVPAESPKIPVSDSETDTEKR